MMSIRKIHFIASTFPPNVCGVGDFTHQLSTALASRIEVKVLTACGEPSTSPDIKVEQVFSNARLRSIFSVIEPIAVDNPDWVVIQYDPFSYGARYGINPCLPLAINTLKRRCPQVKIGIIVHESFIQVLNWKSRALSIWLMAQLWALCRVADAVFTTTEPWVARIQSWFPKKTIEHLPVGSNIPYISAQRDEVRASIGISDKTIVFGLFGRVQKARNLELVRTAVRRTRDAGFDVLVLYFGLDPSGARKHLGSSPLIAEGPLTPTEISRRFAAIDIYMVPIDEGVSTRRTTLMTGLQHGVPTVATFGKVTDKMLLEENGKAFCLTNVSDVDEFAHSVLELVASPSNRSLLSEGAKQLFKREFSWNRISSKFLSTLESNGWSKGSVGYSA